jgi:hypothetical protein
MKSRWIILPALVAALTFAAVAQQGDQGQQPGGNPPGRRGGMGAGMGDGVIGTVSEVASDHYTIKTETGETYTVHFSANTRILKQPPMPAGGEGRQNGMSTPPQSIQATDIKAGDMIMARGEVDHSAKSVGAMFIVQVDPERVKRMQAMEANFGKTWLMGRITAIDGTKVTLEGGPNHGSYSFVADENTTFRRRREPITLADIKAGDNVRAEGAVKDGQFVATTVSVMMPRAMSGPAPRQGTTPPQ